MKGEAGESEVALTAEERLYDDAMHRLKQAREDLDKARKRLGDWVGENGDDNDRYRQLQQDMSELKQDVKDANDLLKDANDLLKDAERRWKDARAAAAEKANHQRNAMPTMKKPRGLAEIFYQIGVNISWLHKS